jgi:long-chain acyl-CoA synthetase
LLDSKGIERIVRDLYRHASGQARSQLEVSQRIQQFFQLYRWRVAANRNQPDTASGWAEFLPNLLLKADTSWVGLTVASSGTTGEPKQISHSKESLLAEVNTWNDLIPNARRVLSFVPSHHLYGLIWTVLWPGSRSIEVVDARDGEQELRSGDVIVAVPTQWRRLVSSLGAIPRGVTGISSAGQLSASLWNEAVALGLERMVEVYGSSETGGVATRESPGQGFRLALHWAASAIRLAEVLPDEVEFAADGSFRLLGRKDGAVKIAGMLVCIAEVEQALLDCPKVKQCRVELIGKDETASLEALIVPSSEIDSFEELEGEIVRWLQSLLPTAAVPRRFRFDSELPTD